MEGRGASKVKKLDPELKKRIHYVKSMRCPDGRYRRNCVVHDGSGGMLDYEKGICGKQMVAWVDMSPLMPKVRMCQEHLDSTIWSANWNRNEERIQRRRHGANRGGA